jgi:hypothetical protein
MGFLSGALFLLDGLIPNYGLGEVKAIMERPPRDMVVDPAHIPPPGIFASCSEWLGQCPDA